MIYNVHVLALLPGNKFFLNGLTDVYACMSELKYALQCLIYKPQIMTNLIEFYLCISLILHCT